MSRELLRRAISALEKADNWNDELIADIRAELERQDTDDSLTAAFMLGYQSAKNDYGRKE